MREILCRGKSEDTLQWVEGWYYKTYCKTGIQERGHFKYINCLPETIGQYTGLTDKNGRKIFEGDIGRGVDGLFLVRWSEGKSAFVMNFYDYPCEELYLEEMWDDSEVIGNIHDNPELLEGGGEG